MVDIGHGINSIVVCLEEATSKITRSMSSSLKYLQSKQVAERNSTSEREALSEKPEEDAMKRVTYHDSREANFLSLLHRYVLLSTLDVWVTYLRRNKAFFYYFITALVAYIFIVSCLRWLLWTLGMFCIMVAFGAARICWRLAISALFARDGGKKAASEVAETLQGVRRQLLILAALVVIVTYRASWSTRDAFLFDDKHFPEGRNPKLRGRHLERPVVAFLYFNSMAFMASLVVLLLLRRDVTWHGHGFSSWALWVCAGLALIRITGALAIWSSRRSLTISICFSALVVAVPLCIGLQVLVFLRNPVADLVSDPQETIDVDKHGPTSRVNVLLLATLAATITYQAGLKPPGGLWQGNATDGLPHYHAGDPIIPHTIYPQIYQAFFYCNATAFAASLVILILLLSIICRNQGIKYCTLQVFMTGGSCSESDPVVDKDNPNNLIKRAPLEATWRVACTAPHHMTGNRSLLLNGGYLPMCGGNDGEVLMLHPATNGEAVPLRVHGSGSVRTKNIALDDVWYVPGLDSNLVSTGQLARQDCTINLGPDGCRITRGGALIGTARFTEACKFELDFLKVA